MPQLPTDVNYKNNTKKCSSCKKMLPFNNFSKDKSSKSGYYSKCKKCHKQYDIQRKSNTAIKKPKLLKCPRSLQYSNRTQIDKFEVLSKEETFIIENYNTQLKWIEGARDTLNNSSHLSKCFINDLQEAINDWDDKSIEDHINEIKQELGDI